VQGSPRVQSLTRLATTSFVQRAWVTLEEKNIPYQYIEINPYHKEKSFLQLNPRGLVPTLACPQKDGSTKPLYESNIICEYLDETSPAPSLYPEDKYQKARMKIWIDHITSRIIPTFHRFLQHTKDSPYSLDEARTEFLGHLKTWIEEADATGPYFMGEQFSMADIALAPWAVRVWVLDHFKEGGLGMPEKGKGGEDEDAWERWRVWVKAIEGRKSVKETMSEKEHYLPIYTRYAEDRAQSELAKATRKGRGVP
jgi:glutathione S-transferase